MNPVSTQKKIRFICYFVAGVFLLSFLGCSNSDKSNPITPERKNQICISVSVRQVTINEFWKDGTSQSFTFNGEIGSTNEVTNLITGEKVNVRFSNIRYSGISVSSLSATLNGGPHSNRTLNYPANKCNES